MQKVFHAESLLLLLCTCTHIRSSKITCRKFCWYILTYCMVFLLHIHMYTLGHLRQHGECPLPCTQHTHKPSSICGNKGDEVEAIDSAPLSSDSETLALREVRARDEDFSTLKVAERGLRLLSDPVLSRGPRRCTDRRFSCTEMRALTCSGWRGGYTVNSL